MRAQDSFGPDLWIFEGPLVRDMGFLFATRMVVAKLADGALWVSSPVAVSSETLKFIDSLGPVKYLVAATPRHVWRLASWHELYPNAELWAARTTPFTLKKGFLPLTGTLEDTPPRAWKDDFDQLAFRGNPLIEEVCFFHWKSRTLLVDDLIQYHPRKNGKLLRNLLLKLEGVADQYGVGLDIRLSFLHRERARESLKKLLSWDFDKLIVAHGPCIERHARAIAERAFGWLREGDAEPQG